MARKIDLIGKRFGRLTVLSQAASKVRANGTPRVAWNCRCECGNIVVVAADSLRTGNTKSCGCYNLEKVYERSVIHGHARRGQGTPEYRAWADMRKRCGADENYLDVRVCAEWSDFETFLRDMGPKPDREYSLDRIDPAGDYKPENCRWIPLREQAANKRNTRRVQWRGSEVSAGTLARRLGIHRVSLYRMLDKGISVEDAVCSLLDR